MFPSPRTRRPQNGQIWAYPPLPPQYTLPSKKPGDSYLNSFDYRRSNRFNDRVKRIVEKFNNKAFDHENSDCDSLYSNSPELQKKFQKPFPNLEPLENVREERMRGGFTKCCMSVEVVSQKSGHRRVRQTDATTDCDHLKPRNSCHNNCSHIDVNVHESPILKASSPCHPIPDSRPVCAEQVWCNSRCRSSELPGCGGGGCCGAGCREGCGKFGQYRMPMRTCSISPYRDNSFVAKSHWSLSKADTPRPVSHGSTQTGRRRSEDSLDGVFKGMQTADEYDYPKPLKQTKYGCECFGGGADCQRCGRKVYQAEMMIAAGSPYHNICFSCYCCRKPLEPLTYQENCGEIYCKQCLIRNFGPQGYGYGTGAGTLQTPI